MTNLQPPPKVADPRYDQWSFNLWKTLRYVYDASPTPSGSTEVFWRGDQTWSNALTGDFSVDGDVTFGTNSANTLTLNAGTVTLGSDIQVVRASLATVAGINNFIEYAFDFTGHSGGTTDARGILTVVESQGANNVARSVSNYALVQHSGSGTVSQMIANIYSAVNLDTGTVTIAVGSQGSISITGAGNITNGFVFSSTAPVLSSTGAFTNLIGFRANNLGHATLVGTSIGFDCVDFTASPTLSIAYRSLMTSGSGKWAFFSSGNANNAFVGNVRIGSTTAPTVALDVTGSVIISNNLTVGDAIGDSFTINAGVGTIAPLSVWTTAGGTVAAGTVNLLLQQFTATGDPGGTSNIRAYFPQLTISGANAVSNATAFRPSLTHAGSATITNTFANLNATTLSSTGNVTLAAGAQSSFNLTNSGSITTAIAFFTGSPTFTSTGTITSHIGFRAADMGHATLIGTAVGFDVLDFTTSPTLTVGFRSAMTSGSNKWAYLATGTANSAFAGNVRVGSTVAPTVALDVTGTIAASVTVDPDADGGANLGQSGLGWGALFLSSGSTINIGAGDVVFTHSANVLVMSGGDLQVTSPGTDPNSVVTQSSLSSAIAAQNSLVRTLALMGA